MVWLRTVDAVSQIKYAVSPAVSTLSVIESLANAAIELHRSDSAVARPACLGFTKRFVNTGDSKHADPGTTRHE
jgi:hypothetical protein